ncbi:TRAP transporter small permease subunit [Piscinibacter gummiphilus]|uniref:TRAP transporter small permease protein n=1 Tax=Piscinibacter gummiphilus TaxID=946333 RepID=A0ABZ0D4W5_9BURK|nr:TRAP transporter small permease subunit [Piscinibacter gummiphilus]WOB10365.1 TRAP transporter small permease subunit [Piscinibacter gummiphilus]
MSPLLSLSRWIDRFSEFIGRWVAWLVLAAVLISAANAVVRKAFNTSSNAFLEIQWYLFAGVFLLAAGYTLLRQEHVKIDVIVGRFSKRVQIWVDIVGLAFFLLPFVVVVFSMVMPLVLSAYHSGEVSPNAGGLIRWPVYALLPLGLLLLGIQAISELIKRVAFLKGMIPDPTLKAGAKSAEEELAEFLLQKEVAAREQALVKGGDK